ncbi:hypothetical protein K402DRAFT_327933 [Aulographum hederae CBS 113979]|uniref:Heterokaryon incompatibility domain-containing protein n=1 Tax=Aulographum hederae CBS 113979 TaxID=1176131 RepID=A0A6G1H647_9PEZI|nr:hypothetical protein K402DRAFT_327933 [Aulographum hederae CBS 113979]
MPYLSLSYCWGKLPNPNSVATTTANFQQRLTCISPSDIPRAISDNLVTTKKLGFRYLWVDAICIIQDSAEDWAAECSLMASVYSNADCMIAVTDSTNSNQG